MKERHVENQKLNFKIRGFDKREISNIDIIAEIRDLQQRGLLHIPTTFDGGNNSDPIQLNKLLITVSGLFFCEILSLDEIEEEILHNLNKSTSIKG